MKEEKGEKEERAWSRDSTSNRRGHYSSRIKVAALKTSEPANTVSRDTSRQQELGLSLVLLKLEAIGTITEILDFSLSSS